MNDDDDEQQTFLDDISPDYIQRPEDPYPTLQSTRMKCHLVHDDDTNPSLDDQEEREPSVSDEMDVYLKSMSPHKHQAYLIEDVLQSMSKKFLVAQQESEQRFITFLTEQKRDDQLREERIHREQRQHQFDLVQMILTQGTIENQPFRPIRLQLRAARHTSLCLLPIRDLLSS